MPYVVRPRPRGLKHRITRLLGVAAVALFGLPAAAQAACPATPTAKVFSAFGDSAYYSLVSNGAFESGTTGWTLTGAAVAAGNESYKVHAATDTKSLSISPTGLAVSPAFCVDIAQPTFRLFAKRTSGTWGQLAVRLRWKDSSGATNETTVASLGTGTSWAPSDVLSLGRTLPLWQSSQTLSVQLVFDPEDFGGAWAIDDVYIDPYTRG
jgi:hypothetical protein